MSLCDVTQGILSRDLTHGKAEQMNIAAQLIVISVSNSQQFYKRL